MGVEAAGQQNFVHQLVQLGNVAQNFSAKGGCWQARAHQLQPHADARERRAQLVRGIGQQRFVRAHQGFNARGGGVELARQLGHFVIALHGNAGRQVALAKALHAALQHIKPLEKAPDDGEHPHGHRQADQGQHPDKTKGRAHPEGGVRAVPSTGGAVAPGRARANLQAVAAAVLAVDAQLNPFPRRSRCARGQARHQGVACAVSQHHFAALWHLGLRILFGRHAPGPAHQQRQHRYADDDSQPDAQVQTAGEQREHGAVSPAAWQTHNPHRAR